MKYENYIIIIYNIYIIYNNEFRTEFCGKGCVGKMTIVICHNCHFLVERCLDTPCGHLAGAQGDWSPVRFTPDSNAYYTVLGISTSIKYGGRMAFLKYGSEATGEK